MTILSIIPSRQKLVATKDNEIYAAVRLTAPKTQQATRQRIAVAVALDISGSMGSGTGVRLPNSEVSHWERYSGGGASKLDLAKYGLERLVENLSIEDTFSLVTFNDHVRIAFETTPMTPDGKRRALIAIRSLGHSGSTALAGGLYEAINQLARTAPDVTRRVMLFTDGEANVGEQTLDAIQTQLLYRFRNEFPGISTFGFGQSYNGELLGTLAQRGGAHYYIRDAELLPTAFGTELGSLASLYGRNVELTVTPADGVKYELLNDLRANGQAIACDDLYSEQTYNVILKLTVPKRKATAKTPVPVLTVNGKLVDVATGGVLSFTERLEVGLVAVRSADKDDNPDVMSAVAVQIAAREQREAMAQARRGDVAGARQRLLRSADVMKGMGREDLGLIACDSANVGYNSAHAYAEVGSKLSSSLGGTLSRQTAGMGGQQVGGVNVDALFSNSTQKRMANAFSITKTAGADADDMPDVDAMVTSR